MDICILGGRGVKNTFTYEELPREVRSSSMECCHVIVLISKVEKQQIILCRMVVSFFFLFPFIDKSGQ